MAPSSRISRLSLLLLFSASQLIPQVVAFTQCYYPDGSIPTDFLWAPCKSESEGHSACCDSRSGDVCQPNGLCLWSSSDSNNTYRGTCTDRTWKDPSCPNICLDGEEDDLAWTTPCASKSDGSDLTYVCGTRDKVTNQRIASNCTGGASRYTASFIFTLTTSSKATRFTPPPTVDPKIFSVFTETYITKVTAYEDYTTLTTTWESTFTSSIGGGLVGTATSTSTDGKSITGTQAGAVDSTTSADPKTSKSPSSSGPSPAVLGGAIGGGVVVIALLAGLLFFLRKKRSAKEGTQRIDSPPPANGPVGRDQVNPYEVSGADAPGSFAPDKKYVYENGNGNAGAYEMSSAGEKGWGGQNVAEVGSGDQRLGAYEMGGGEKRFVAEVSGTSTPQHQYQNQQHQNQQWNGQNGQLGQVGQNGEVTRSGTVIISPMSPAPAYGLLPSRAGAVEMDGSDYAPSRPTTATGSVRGRNGVGNA